MIGGHWFRLLTLAGVISACGCAGAQTAPSNRPGDASRGKEIYAKYGCYECHGYVGQGSPLSGSRLAPDPLAFSAFKSYIRQPPGQMPPYTDRVLTDAEMADIYTFLKSLPKPPTWRSVPILSQQTRTKEK
jgi:ubiquinol-cytochrome c reductase cytochrome c subunit